MPQRKGISLCAMMGGSPLIGTGSSSFIFVDCEELPPRLIRYHRTLQCSLLGCHFLLTLAIPFAALDKHKLNDAKLQ